MRYIKRARQRVDDKPKPRPSVEEWDPAWSLAFAGTLFASVFSLQLPSLSWLSNWSILMPYLRKQGGT